MGQTSIILSADSFPNDTAGSSGYYFTNTTNSTNSGWIQTNSWQETGLSCGATYNYTIKYRNGDGTETSTASTQSTTANCAGGGGTPLWFLEQINNANQTNNNNSSDTITVNNIPSNITDNQNNTPGNNVPFTIEQILTEAKIVNSADINKIAAEAKEKRDVKIEVNYDKILIAKILSGAESAALKKEDRDSLSGFISYGTKSTKNLGASERAGVINSFKSAFGKLPTTEAEWNDAVKIANGRWPSQKSAKAEDRVKINFKIIYQREPNRKNPLDDAAITVMAYGLRPAKRNLTSEKAAIKTFQAIYGYNPFKATAWDVIRAIAYSGAKR